MPASNKGMATQKRGQLGVNAVENIVLSQWNCRWQPVDAQNDDGVDGLIFIERGGETTGQIVFVQVKCTNSTSSNGRTSVSINQKKLSRNVTRWRKLVGAAILIHVDPKTMKATWANLRDHGAIGNTQVYVPTTNNFDKHSKNVIADLCGTMHRDVLLPQIDTDVDDFRHLKSREHLQTASRTLYKELSAAEIRLGLDGPAVRFTGDGWKHMTRRRRSHLSEIQSFTLLGVVRKVLEATPESALVSDNTSGVPEGTVYAARAAVTFPFRQTAIVKIVLRKSMNQDGSTAYSFFTVYEPKRKRNVLGTRGPLFLQAT
jgi:hypothetical protein